MAMLMTTFLLATSFILVAISFSAAKGTAITIISASHEALVGHSMPSTSAFLLVLLISSTRALTFSWLLAKSNNLLFPFDNVLASAEPILPVAPIIAIVCFVLMIVHFR